MSTSLLISCVELLIDRCYHIYMIKRKIIKNTSIYGIIGNIFLLILKGFVGILFQSQTMIADAANSAGDIFASLMSFLGNKISTLPADEDHNLGHGKAEYIFSLFIGLSMCLISTYLIIECIKKLLLGRISNFSILLIITCFITIIIKLLLYIYTRKVFLNTNNILMKALYTDHRNDCIITSLTLISVIFAFYNIYWFDSISGIIISVWIIISGINLIIESYNVLMDQSIDLESTNKIKEIISNFSKEIKMGKMSSIPIGNKYIIVLTIFIDGKTSTLEAHSKTKLLQKEITKKIKKIDRVIIHVNPLKK